MLCFHKEKHKEPEINPVEITKNKIVESNLSAGIETTTDKSSRTEHRAMYPVGTIEQPWQTASWIPHYREEDLLW